MAVSDVVGAVVTSRTARGEFIVTGGDVNGTGYFVHSLTGDERGGWTDSDIEVVCRPSILTHIEDYVRRHMTSKSPPAVSAGATRVFRGSRYHNEYLVTDVKVRVPFGIDKTLTIIVGIDKRIFVNMKTPPLTSMDVMAASMTEDGRE